MTDQQHDDPYEPLYEQYKKDLRGIYDQLVKERDEVIGRLMDEEKLSGAEAANRFSLENGPLVHDPRVIHIIRKYWLRIAELKKEMLAQRESYLEPLTFLVEDLIDDNEDELVEFLAQIAYWPVGLDENNDWI